MTGLKWVRKAQSWIYWTFHKPCDLPFSILLFILDAGLSLLILNRISYTEIDWVAYMQQIEMFNAGERDYSKITGQTGPLVYPGGHVIIYRLLYALTDSGTNIQAAQSIFLCLYLATLAIILSIFRKAKVPIALAALYILSKRIHSIYLLRLFNDCFMTLFAAGSVCALQSRKLALSTLLMSIAISIKMAAILYLPGLALICWNLVGFKAAILALPFILPQYYAFRPFQEYPWQYFKGAFDFERKFLYKWSVNWKMFSEDTFTDEHFANWLLILHISTLIVFAVHCLRSWRQGKQFLNGRKIAKIMATSNLIGILFARSLHYQFYSWFYWTLPILLVDRPCALFAWPLLEFAWNKYPASPLSSYCNLVAVATLVLVNI